jgi:hypothetical protein
MSLSSLITDIKTKIFGDDKPKIAKITPIFDTEFIPAAEYMPDLEAGEGGAFYKRLRQREAALELHSKPKNSDLEKGNRSIICGEVAIDFNGYEKCRIIENYVSFMDVVNYFSTPITERGELPFIMDDIIPYSEPHTSSSHIAIDMNDYTEPPLHLCSSNIL